MKYYVIAGEASGDLHAANLMKAIVAGDENAEFRFWGGDQMAEVAGNPPEKHYKELAFMGFVEVIMNLRTILGNLKLAKADIEAFQPDALVLIDYPGFNMRIAEWAKKQGIRIYYYISPQIWAWKQNRVHALKRDVTKMLTILPFEQAFYRGFDMDVDYVGHPLLDAIQDQPAKSVADVLGNDDGRPVVALLPGSRKQEIKAMLNTMLEMPAKYPNYRFVVAGAPSQSRDFYDSLGLGKAELLMNKTYDLLSIAHAACVTSGTATLETALFNVPEVVCYRGNSISYQIAKRLVKVKYISLVNLIADREVVVELIQREMNAKRLSKELGQILEGPKRETMLEDYKVLRQLLGGGGASQRAAEIIIGDIQK
ncbi:lipid-A-disaccharide synthase [Phaeocystidibacter luteus]|uniref:Lipid-A-disaccharide synthase n=1 Tax=Phaeocystidibacter luteus TaxID=911197 RepID=A0A6N6RH13_9FLAO|nr:lipid-A-disaccharide synthase [Phaeocystidibacter luteus]KAB2810033.1 lipid-A-disaccharide synthase [Phaeocystidibacter luteus]